MGELFGFSEVSYTREGRLILPPLSWSLAAGRNAVVLGPNGCGKTTLLAMLNGMAAPSSGEIRCFGQRYGCSDWNAVKRRIGMVSARVQNMISFNEPTLWVVLSGLHSMVNFWGVERPAECQRALKVLDDLGIRHLADEPFGQLSQGERQRALIGRALMADPRLLILDEPCAGLDPIARVHFLRKIQQLAERDPAPAIVMITHHVEEILPCFDEVLLLGHRGLVASGTVEGALTDAALSEAFQASVALVGDSCQGFSLRIAP